MSYLSLHDKINQLPFNLLGEVENYIYFLLQKHRQARFSQTTELLTLEEIQEIVTKRIPPEENLADELIAERRQEAKYE